jgi:inner membrane transporter RhtA
MAKTDLALARRPPLALPIALEAVAMISFQTGAALVKNLFPVVGAEGAASLRLGFSALIMLIAWRPWRTRFDPRRQWAVLVYGAVLGAMNLLFYLALQRTPVGVAVAVEFLGPLTLALLGSRRLLDFAWVALAVVGIGLLLPIVPSAAPLDPIGVMFALGAGACWALYIVFGQKAGATGRGHAAAYGAVVAALAPLPFGVAHAGAALLAPGVLGLGLLVAQLSGAIPYSLEIVVLTRMPRKTFGILSSANPAIGALMGLLVLGERLSLVQMLAIGAIMTASVGAVATQAAPRPEPS